MARYQFRFSIPDAQQGNHQIYTSYVSTLKRLGELKGAKQGTVRVDELQSTGGSVAGTAMLEAPTCEEAMRFVCRETPIIDLEWHVQEFVDPVRMAEILETALKRR